MITEVKENTRENPSSKSVDELDFTGEATRVFEVQFDDNTGPVEQQTLCLDPGVIDPVTGVYVPLLWESHPFDPWMYVINKTQTWMGGNIRRVTVNYSRQQEPLSIPPRISWGFATSNEAIDKDSQGNVITNSSGESPDPPITDEIDDLIMRIAVNWESFDHLLAADYKGAVNSDIFYDFPVGTCKIKVFDGDETRIAGLTFWSVTIEIQIRYDSENDLLSGWKKRFLDEGFRVKSGTDDDGATDYEILKDKDGNPLSQPVLLDGEGAKLVEGNDPVFLEFETYKLRPFAALGIF